MLLLLVFASCRETPTATTKPQASVENMVTPRDAGLAIGDDEEDFSSLMSVFIIAPVPADFLLVKTTVAESVRIEASGKTTIREGGSTKTVTLSGATLGRIVAGLQHEKFFEMKSEYGTGAPATTIAVTMNGTTKTVRHNFGDLLVPVAGKDAASLLTAERQAIFEVESDINIALDSAGGGK